MQKVVTVVAACLTVMGAALSMGTETLAKTMVYVSAATDGEINTYSMDENTGALSHTGNVAAGASVMPMAVNAGHTHLYAVVRSQPFRVLTYGIDANTGALTQQAVAALPDSMPYISVENSGRLLFFASYGGHKIASLPIGADSLAKEGARQVIATGRNAHAIVSEKSGKYVFVTNLGSDVILQFILNPQTGMLEPNSPPSIATKTGQGPRHIAISPDNKSLYVVTELTGEVIHYALDPARGTLTVKEAVAILAPGHGLEPGATPAAPAAFNAPPKSPMPASTATPPAKIWAADIGISPDGRFIYATERSTSTITTFAVDLSTGALSRVGSVETEKQPRGIRIDPAGRFLIASGEKSDQLSVYSIDPKDGLLKNVGRYPVGKGANWVEIVKLP